MKQSATDVVAVLAIIAGAAASVATSALVLWSPADDVAVEVAPVVYSQVIEQYADQVYVVEGDRVRISRREAIEQAAEIVRARRALDESGATTQDVSR